MSTVSTECRVIQRDMLRRDDLDAVERLRLDVHLRRCEGCRFIAEGMKHIENPTLRVPELDEERRNAIYAKLVPTVEQLTARVLLSCKQAQDLLAAHGTIEGASRAKLSAHLDSCSECSLIADRLENAETAAISVPPLTEDARVAIYSRLVPAVHEIAERNARKSRRFWPWEIKPTTVLAGTAAALVIVVVAVMTLDRGAESLEPAGPLSIAASADGGVDMEFSEGEVASREEPEGFGMGDVVVDRVEGDVLVDGDRAGQRSRLQMRKGTKITSDAFGQLSFRMNDKARVALLGESHLTLTKISRSFLEMYLESGRIAVEFDGTAGQTMHVTTPTSIVRVKGTTFTVEALTDGTTRVGVIEGVVEVASRKDGNVAVEVAANQSVSFPGEDGIEAISDEQRTIAAELTHGQTYPAELTRLLRFAGSPENVKVEVDGRVVGITPLTIRVPDGPHTYKLTAPGMVPVVGELAVGSEYEEIGFELVPSQGDYPVLEEARRKVRKRRVRRRNPSRRTGVKTAEPSAEENDPGSGWDLFKRARAAMAAGDVPYAISLLEKATEQSEGDRRISGLSLLAECYGAVGRYRRAAETFEQIIGMVPNSTAAQNARYEVARLAMDRLGDLSRARTFFRAYLNSPLGGALREEAHYSLCEINGRQGAHRQALECFDTFLATFPGAHHEPEAQLWRGALYQDIEGKWGSAERDLRAFIEARPEHPRTEEALYRLAIGRFRLGDKKSALTIISEYLSKFPRGRYRLRVERLRAAITDPAVDWEAETGR